MTVWDCGSKPARTREKALSTSCESTFIGLRKYIQQLMKALSKICCPCHQRTYTYFVGEVLLTCPMKYIFFEKEVYLLTMTENTSQIICLFTAFLHTFCDFFLRSFTAMSDCSRISSQVQRKCFFRLPQSNHEKPLRRKPCGWRRKASIEPFNVYGATLSSSSVATCPYCFCAAFWYCRTL